MNNKLAKILGLFFLAVIAFGWLGQTIQEGNAGGCPSVQVSTYPTLGSLEIPNNKRSQIYLNGVWQFIPAVDNTDQQLPQDDWGSIWVPGDWQQENYAPVPGVISRGTGTAWQNFNGKQLSKAWYQHTLKIPADWQGRSIFLDLQRVSTDAVVYVNGIQCGQVDSPYGAVDITSMVQPGTEATLSLLVVAAADEKEKTVIMSPNETYTTAAELASRGLIGEVRLLSLPQGSHISDVFVQPSTRQKQINLDIELNDITQTGTVELVAKLFNEQGKIEQQFTANAEIKTKPTQVLQIAWDWSNPRLWDISQPNVYTLRLDVKGAGIDDEYDQPFGFREFWIEGRKFYLNGTEIRLRPILHEDQWQGWAVGVPEVADKMIDAYFWAGFNIAELWPWNHDERGRWHFRELFAERADLKGFPLISPALSMSHIGIPNQWNKQADRKRWEQRMATELRRYRNHPSILMWTNSPNFFGHADDQNPRRIGQKQVEGSLGKDGDWRVQNMFPIGEKAVATIKKYDPTRPVLMHQGASVGDVYALNSYLNMIPLQEREEWLSEWTQDGDMPYMVVEFGTPLHATMMRSRNGFGNAITSEPLMTEFSAIYLGKEAYELETPAYRSKIRELFVKDQEYQSWHNQPELDFAPAFQKLQQLFSTNTWRSWRTFGMTGGMIPWSSGHGWEVSDAGKEMVNIEPFEPGRRGPYLKQVRKSLWYSFQPQGNIIHPGGQGIMENNSPTLAWIAGAEEAFTAKDHSFRAGEKLQKQVVLINDTRAKQEFSFTWQVLLEGKPIASGDNTGTIETAQTLFFPIAVNLPEVNGKVNGEVRLNAQIGNQKHQDNFPFRVFTNTQSPVANRQSPIAVFDPVGKTTQMLQQLGYNVESWNGSFTSSLLVIGREALSSGDKLPGNLEAFIGNGGRAIVFTQNPDWMSSTIGWRIAPHLSRRVFLVNETHLATSGLDELDLRDWAGESTLVEAYPDTTKGGMNPNPHGTPWYGWHWGNRGAVSSASVEKPHRSSWRPILESEFDLAYTPLMELDYGKGRLIWSTLDLDDHLQLDAAARQLARQLIAYSTTAPLSPKVDKVIFIGSDADVTQLDELGLIYQRTNSLTADAGLVIIGTQAKVNDEQLRAYLNKGGKIFFLPRHTASAPLGITMKQVKAFPGSLNVPQWSEAYGLSASDLRSRTEHDAWLIQSGGEIAADGLLSRVQLGNGVAIFSQIDPNALNADVNTYLRYTRWRQTRALAQILANLGASFQVDGRIFKQIGQKQNQHSSFTADRGFYHPDYRTDFDLGDEPYRYYRW
ncbi:MULTISPECIES: glycoside hydrolase family 2 protein [unclassified Coleofasciculus]|uniref:glycoside hydrolase family 2 protein n=1 Tax=unclassified Coleofasciculus TaxID=2692782 RepID=UPI0018824B78|nr:MULTISPECIES: sugar-binding domain-containing protein [unclassified Coleofasciculus]MBE9126900.1 beta-galactosidase [Coleofasciculus sp. LEGE 07081]MBE9150204.1 beta-galactosidase [Coleofasciculus sp. LEGE 07092]